MTSDNYLKVLLALVAWREARGEALEGIRAVMHVIRNRVLAGWGDWDDVITKRNQFSSMSVPGDTQLVKWPDDDSQEFRKILGLAISVFEGNDPDNTCGALYYENPVMATSEWFIKTIRADLINHPSTAHIGHHVFYA